MDVKEEELQGLYEWVDGIPLSRPKRNIARDFSDGVLLAECVHHFFPKLVELHNYSAANGVAQKLYNWSTLNQRVFRRMGFVVAEEECKAVVNCEPGAVERVLKLVKTRMAKFQEQGACAAAAGGGPGGGRLSRSGSAGSSSQPASPAAAQGQGYYEEGNGAAAPADVMAGLKLGPGSKGRSSGATSVHVTAGALPPVEQALKATIADKELALQDLRETNEILETKIRKLEQLVRLKDAKIQALLQKMAAAGIQ